MSKKCIFNENKICNDCKECETCELDKNKICDNCGKCLELEGYDVKAIKIDEVFEENEDVDLKEKNNEESIEIEKVDLGDFSDFDLEEENEDDSEFELNEEENEEYVDIFDLEEGVSYIDDIDELKELIEEGKELGDELFPGLIKYHK